MTKETMSGNPIPNVALLYEHISGEHRLATNAEAATFALGDPDWQRVGPIDLPATTIDMVLFCPKCGVQHVDKAEAPGPNFYRHADEDRPWDNPPHRSHLCHGCGHIWRPADVPTNGVAAIKTAGKADSQIAEPATSVDAALTQEPELYVLRRSDGSDFVRYDGLVMTWDYPPTPLGKGQLPVALYATPQPAASAASGGDALIDAVAHLAGAASAYRMYAKRHPSQGKAAVDALFSTRAADFDKAVERGRAALAATAQLQPRTPAEPSDAEIIRLAVAAMPDTNPLVAEDLIGGFTMHAEADDIVAIWRAAAQPRTPAEPSNLPPAVQQAGVAAARAASGHQISYTAVCAAYRAMRDALAAQPRTPDAPSENFVSIGYQYEFNHPFGGTIWRDSPDEYNGSRYIGSREVFAAGRAATPPPPL